MAVNVTGGELDFRATLDTKPFDRNVKKLKSEIAQVNKGKDTMSKSVDKTTQSLTNEAVATKAVIKQNDLQVASIRELKIELEGYRRKLIETNDPQRIRFYNQEIGLLQKEITRTSNIGREGFDSMGVAIEKTTKKSSGFTRALGKVWGGVRKLAYILPGFGIAGILALAIDPLSKLISGMDIFNKKTSQARENMNALNSVVSESNKQAGQQLSSLKILYGAATDVSLAMKDRVVAAEELQRTFPDAFANSRTQAILNGEEKRTYDDLTESILKTARAKAAKDKLDDIEAKRLDIAFQKEKIRNANENEKIRATRELKEAQDALNATYSDQQAEFRATDKQIDKQVQEAHKLSDARAEEALKIQDEQDKMLKSQADFLIKYVGQENLILAGKGKGKGGSAGLGAAASATSISAAARIYQQIADIRAGYARQMLDQDEAELQAARDKFAKIAQDIQKFNADPKNKIKIELAPLNELRDQVIADLTAKQNAIRNKIEQEQDKKRLDDALKLASTYEKELTEIHRKYAEARTVIGDKLTEEEAKALDAGRKREVDSLNERLVEDLDSYKAFFDGLASLSGKRLNDVAEQLEKDLAGLVKKYPQLKAIAEIITKRIGGEVAARSAEDFRNMADAFSFMADSVKDLDSGLSAALSTIGDIAGQVFNLKRDMSDFDRFQKQGNVLGSVASGLGIVGAGFNIMTTINKLFDRETAADRQRVKSAAMQLQATEGLTKALERQIKVAQEAYGTQKIEEYTKAIKDAEKVQQSAADSLSSRRAFTGSAELDSIIEKMNKGEKLSGWSIWGPSDRKLGKRIEDGFDTINADVETLQNLLDNRKLDDQTAKIAQDFIDAADAIKDAENAIISFNTGIEFDTLSDNLIDAISSGNDAIKELGENFEETMKNAILNSLKDGAYQEQMQKFYEDFDKAIKDGLDEEEIADLRKDYDRIADERKQRLEELERISGLDLDSSTESASSLSGTIGRSITEDTANKWMGVQLNIYTINKNMLAESQIQTQSMKQHAGYAMQNLQTALRIERNTANTVLRLDTAITHLTTIATNTKPSKTGRDLGQ